MHRLPDHLPLIGQMCRAAMWHTASAWQGQGKLEYLAGSMVYSVTMLFEQIFGTTWMERDGKLGPIAGRRSAGIR